MEVCHSVFNAGDDAICLKAGKDKEARQIEGPCTNIHIHHCYAGYCHGGFVVGSEMSRDVRNVLVEDCTFMNSDVGVRLKSAMGRGGVVEDIYIRNINMINIKKEAFVISMDYVHNLMDYYDEVVVSDDEEDIPHFRNIYVSNCTCNADMAVRVAGIEGRSDTISGIFFEGCDMTADRENILKDCERIVINA